jgi:CBS domain-containing protein
MITRNSLGKIPIKDVRNLVVQNPSTISPDGNIDELLSKINENLKTRHVYVVDKNNKLVGSVRINSIVQYLFPMSAILSAGVSTAQFNVNLLSQNVSDIMKKDPFSVKEDDLLSKVGKIMIKEGINEVPVVDDAMHLIGEVNIFEVIEAYKTINNK